MKLQFKHQKFQEKAAQAVVDVFRGQPYDRGLSFIRDFGSSKDTQTQIDLSAEESSLGIKNSEISNALDLRHNIEDVQRNNDLEPKYEIGPEGLRLTIEMETGTGKTYTYIKTMFELRKQYGWSKFIIVVPSIAIREGVLKSFQVTQEHFTVEYGERINFFIYNSEQLTALDQFASSSGMQAMIINTQAFNARGEAANRINRELDSFRSRKPIDVVAATRPILIIDEPQSVLGTNANNATRAGLQKFRPLFTLLYSATHRATDKQNMIYRLDAMDAYNQKLVKKITVRGVTQKNSDASTGFIYLQEIILTPTGPQARIGFEKKKQIGHRQISVLATQGYDIYQNSGELEQYRNGYIIENIDGFARSITLRNGTTLYEGESFGKVNEELIRRIQIRETIATHLHKERKLYLQGIKVLSLFFIDHVNNYRLYEGGSHNGIYAEIFEEEYAAAIESFQMQFGDEEYVNYLRRYTAEQVHQGYFSRDKKTGNFIEGQIDRSNKESKDEGAYDLIMKDKERLLSLHEPVRFIFSHSALKEGWDNPNVFQICTLKDSDNTTKKRQEVGRGMRLCVNQQGERQDEEVLNGDVFSINNLTVIASESYASFADALQKEIAEAVADRPVVITAELFRGMKFVDKDGKKQEINSNDATGINFVLIMGGYVDRQGKLTKKYYDDKEAGTLNFTDEFNPIKDAIIKRLDAVFNPDKIRPKDDRSQKSANFLRQNFDRREFQELWKKINSKTYYTVDFKTDELVAKSIERLDKELNVSRIRIEITDGTLGNIRDREQLLHGDAMKQGETRDANTNLHSFTNTIPYDLVGKLVESTHLTRRAIIKILQGMNSAKFEQFKYNPEEFIQKVGAIINSQKAISVVESITYHRLDKRHEADIFTTAEIKGVLGENAIESTKSLFDLVVVDSKTIELPLAKDLEQHAQVAVYCKLPRGFYINTPMGKYNPDWAVVFDETNDLKHIYFVAESKGTLEATGRQEVENKKIDCARKHFATIADTQVKYDVITNYTDLLNLVQG